MRNERLAIRKGDYYVDGEIVSINKMPRMTLIITSAGNLYNAHMKCGDYIVSKGYAWEIAMSRE
jgi:hypothetical protein